MGTLGKLFHFSFDAILVSTVIAGVRRSTGLTFSPRAVDNDEAQSFLRRYLSAGEWALDMSSTLMSASGYFERRLP